MSPSKSSSYKTEVIRKLNRFYVDHDDSSNLAGYLANIFMWSTVAKEAENKVKEGYKALVDEKLIKSDDDLRSTVNGEAVPLKTDLFSLLVKVQNPRQTFDKDEFIERVATELKVSKPKLLKIASECIKLSKPPLSKVVIES